MLAVTVGEVGGMCWRERQKERARERGGVSAAIGRSWKFNWSINYFQFGCLVLLVKESSISRNADENEL